MLHFLDSFGPAAGQAEHNKIVVTLALAASAWTSLAYVPARPDNPLKGLVPYAGSGLDRFPQSMEFDYLSLADLVSGDGKYNWEPLERLISQVSGRGNQLVFRVFSEYPGRPDAIPKHLVDQGVKIIRWTSEWAQDKSKPDMATPDYGDPRFQKCLLDFIAALGARYDGDPRIGFITAGLLGMWGEWHNWPRDDELFASASLQARVMDTYEKAFRKTKVLLRYPRGESNPRYAANHLRPFGYHDDSFAYATLDTGRPDDSWHYMTALQAAGPAAVNRWKTQPIGGEIRPEVWGRIFDAKPALEKFQDFAACVKATRATWLMDSGMFNEPSAPDRKQRAIEQVQKMGYELHASGWRASSGSRDIEIQIQVANRGVAPFYYPWRAEAGLFDPAGKAVRTVQMEGTIDGILPGSPPRTLTARFSKSLAPKKGWKVGIRVPNPMKGGKSLRFANKLEGDWLMLSPWSAP